MFRLRAILGLTTLAITIATLGIGVFAREAEGQPTKGAAKKKDEPLPPLHGLTFDYDYDGADVGHPERGYMGRAFVHDKIAGSKSAPLLVFIHGLNVEKIKYRWMGGGTEGDVRRILSELIESGQVAPMVLAAPTSIDPATMVNALTTWPAFDLDKFVDNTQMALGTSVKIDRRRVVVAGHSGAGCNVRGGIASALLGAKTTTVLAGLVIDVCMGTDLALELAKTSKETNVIVSWQEISWANRPTNDFRRVFARAVKANPPSPGILRELDQAQPNAPSPHDAMVSVTLKKWLPRFVPPTPP